MYDVIERLEESKKTKLELLKLPYLPTDLAPVISKKTIDYHYSELANGYVTRYNKNEGDSAFNKAGAFLHNIYFQQFRKPAEGNLPNGPVLNLIKRKYGYWRDFKELFKTEAMQIQGSGWIYLTYGGDIKTIINHEIRDDILLLVDWWEHAWALDYQADKKSYLENTWKIINWAKINTRWGKNL